MRASKVVPWVVALSLAAAACAGSPVRSRLDIDMHEFGIETGGVRFAPGPVDIAIANSGEFPHTLVLETIGGEVIAATDAIRPGSTSLLSLDLRGEAYRLTCRIVTQARDGRVFDHFELGMVAVIEPGVASG